MSVVAHSPTSQISACGERNEFGSECIRLQGGGGQWVQRDRVRVALWWRRGTKSWPGASRALLARSAGRKDKGKGLKLAEPVVVRDAGNDRRGERGSPC